MRKKISICLITLLLIIPINVLAYSNKIVLGGQNTGINIQNNGVIVIGFYKVNGQYNKGSNEIKLGDIITKINDQKISSISELTESINGNIKNNKIELTLLRNNKEIKSILNLYYDESVYKTGLYVKDSIRGIGTITYIDPETMIYGSLGHEIIDSSSKIPIDIKDGYIFESSVTSISKSTDGNPGEKNAKMNQKNVLGTINKNTIYGIFGKYEKDINTENLIDVATKSEVKIGPAYIYTVINEKDIEKFEINITKISESSKIKNITFEITDDKLLNRAGGIVQGMSGSPIVQNDKIIGAVTHVIVDNVKTGYGLFITTMLEEGES